MEHEVFDKSWPLNHGSYKVVLSFYPMLEMFAYDLMSEPFFLKLFNLKSAFLILIIIINPD